MTTTKGRDAIRSLAAKVARTKTGLDDLGKEHVSELKKQTGAVDIQRKLIRDRLDALRDEVRDPLTKFEEAEANRVNEHEGALVLLAGAAVFNTVPTVAEIDRRIAKLSAFATRSWEEFYDRAIEGIDDAANKLNGFREAAIRQEADAAELIELRKLAAENEAREVAARLEATKAENARIVAELEERRIADELADNARRAEQQAEREAARAAQAVRDAEAAAARAVEEERSRVARAEGEAIAARVKLERNKKHRATIHGEIRAALLIELMAPEVADRLIDALACGDIPHVRIEY
jgi:hypothetical protein